MGKKQRPQIFSIASHMGFADSLARYIIEKYGADPAQMAKGLLILPNNRAVAALSNAFLQYAENGLFMPQCISIGDAEKHDQLASIFDPIDDDRTQISLPREIGALERQMILADWLQHENYIGFDNLSASESMRLAQKMADSFDLLDVEKIPISKLSDIGENIGELQEHWQASFRIFFDMHVRWGNYCRENNILSATARRNIILDRWAISLKKYENLPFIIAAGVSTAAPAIANILKSVAALKNGQVILTGLDLKLDDDVWQFIGAGGDFQQINIAEQNDKDGGELLIIDESHPQFHLKKLLERISYARDEFRYLDVKEAERGPTSSGTMLRNAFLPAHFTSRWIDLKPSQRDARNLHLMICEDARHEAMSIALLIRRELEEKGNKIALITPDREIAARVSNLLKRWQIQADDTAGIALHQTAIGDLAMRLLECLGDDYSPISLLSILKHPLVMAGDGRTAWLDKARQLDLLLRGPRLGKGIRAIIASVQAEIDRIKKRGNADAAILDKYISLINWVEEIGQIIPTPNQTNYYISDIFLWLNNALMGLIGDDGWKGDAAKEYINLSDKIIQQQIKGAKIGYVGDWAAIIKMLMDQIMVRPNFGSHPRVQIYGLLEARLQKADVVICAGLNEGTWPQSPDNDPWLAPRIRRELDLPSLDRAIGLSAHDFVEAVSSGRVYMSRAMRDRKKSAVASRFLLRLIAITDEKIVSETEIPALAHRIDIGEKIPPASAPEPKPSKEARKVNLSVTDIDRLVADPFAFYAKKILKLPVLDNVGAGSNAAWRGTMIHDILEQWSKEDDYDVDKLLARGEEYLRHEIFDEASRLFWGPDFLKSLNWVADLIAQHRAEGRRVIAVEQSGEVEIDGVKLRGKVDRIDMLEQGGFAIIDYKTGSIPSKKALSEGFATQLGLCGLLAEMGAFSGVKGQANLFEYWVVKADRDKDVGGKVERGYKGPRDKGGPVAEKVVSIAHQTLKNAIHRWINGDEAFVARLHKEYCKYKDYDHLSRFAEWDGRKSRQFKAVNDEQ
ncbi:double-strand break repair protein AddB [Sphingorhabdus lutea]|uniref:Double-strand break repair protein AddB n=1 Tax=Sphingorhabdus lutea TaxID=1913578 RepID=A0A1L3JCA8_9SPHN|nr:double-strand break repair protein AddB [Sphingorhabdus lutea]APG62764.1 double-strand break repair protein AddB [Sphingorhabdus lutea]